MSICFRLIDNDTKIHLVLSFFGRSYKSHPKYILTSSEQAQFLGYNTIIHQNILDLIGSRLSFGETILLNPYTFHNSGSQHESVLNLTTVLQDSQHQGDEHSLYLTHYIHCCCVCELRKELANCCASVTPFLLIIYMVANHQTSFLACIHHGLVGNGVALLMLQELHTYILQVPERTHYSQP